MTKSNNRWTKKSEVSFRPNDAAFRLILIPVLGILIPLITGMIQPKAFTALQIKLGLLYCIGIAFIVWQGNRSLFFSLRSYFDWHQRPIQKIVALLVTTIFYTVPVSIILLVGWYHIFENGNINWNIVRTCTLIIMICVIFITHVYETIFLVKESENEILRNMELEKAKAVAELEALKLQIDPHFVFNSLNTLSHLIEEKPAKARQFNDALADVYRYILHNKSRELVLLGEEVQFLMQYFSILKIRFEDAIHLQVKLGTEEENSYLITPISLQILVENAIKHNEFSDDKPINIEITLFNEQIIVSNTKKLKEQIKDSSKIGLDNLNKRYVITTGKQISVETNATEFTVKLPLLKIA